MPCSSPPLDKTSVPSAINTFDAQSRAAPGAVR
jgi:hypothetical protein